MEIVFIKKLAESGQTSAQSIQLERALRHKGFWRAVSRVQQSSDVPEAKIVIESNQGREEFTDIAGFQQRFDLDTVEQREAQAACW